MDQDKNLYFINFILLLQGICNGTFTLGAFICVSNMPLGDFSVIIFSTFLPTMILAKILLRLRLYKDVCGILLLVGLVLVVQPPALFGGQVEERKE